MHKTTVTHRCAAFAAICLIGVTALSGCSRTTHSRENWQNPNVAKEDWSLDKGECSRYARREVERAAGPAAASAPSDNLSGGLGTYNQRMTTYDLERLEERAFSACMRTKGYTPIAGS